MDDIAARLRGDTGRLAATYLMVIMTLTVIFSGIIFSISSSQFDRPLAPPNQGGGNFRFDDGTRSQLQDLFAQRAEQAREDLLLSLILLNVLVLIGGACISYVLARKTLQPIEAAMESQARFVSDASHELRTPLTALQVTNEVALRKKKLSLPDAKEIIGYNLAETIKLRDLSEALLGLAKQNDADVSKHPVDIAEVVLDAVQTLRPLADDKSVAIAHDVPSITHSANRSALLQIVRILLDNAIKYSPQNSTIDVSAMSSGTSVVVTVQDHGIGIAPQHQSRIFDRFYRIDESRSSTNVSGNGLGLSIAKAIAKRHGYDLRLDHSGQGSGSTFSLTIA